MLLFSAQVGALAQRIGPRIPLTTGSLVSAAGLLLMLRIGQGASYLINVLPPVVVFGAGLALIVPPLTVTVLDSAPDRYAGTASGVNNAVAHAAGLLAVAVVPSHVERGATPRRGADPVPHNSSIGASAIVKKGERRLWGRPMN